MATGKSTPSPAILGIDLGTTNSLCAVFVGGAPSLVRNAHDSVLTPSVVAVLPGGEVLVGAPAKEVAVTQPERAVSCFKRWMGSDETVVLDGKPFSAAELSSLVLRSLRDDAARELGVVPTEAVVTVPAYFNDNQRRATKAAAEMAGLRVRRIVNEPTAAALAYGFHNRDRSQKLLVIDLGGGTFDVTLMDVFEGTLEIVATAGESQLGGEDFTNRLVAEALAEHGRQLEHVEMQEPLRVARLRQECEQAKRSLGTQESVVIRLPNNAGELSADAGQIDLTAARFADAAKPLLDRLFGPIDRVLRDAGLQPDAVDELILVGGATRMPIVRRAIAERLGREPVASLDPDETVCLGAAVQAALIVDDRAVDDLVMTDVCPHTLGVDTSKQLGGDLRSGYYTPLIHRNTTIPVSREQVFETLRPNQREVQVVVYQGEHRRVENNLKLGELTVRDVPPGPAGQEVLIRFTYDINGILEVEAYAADADPKEKARVVLTHDAGDLDEDEVAAAVEKMRALKYYPREDQRNQFLLRRGERLLGEVSPLHRDQLETAIDALEAALAGSDRELVEAAAEGLLFTLSALGMDPNEGEAADGIEGDD